MKHVCVGGLMRRERGLRRRVGLWRCKLAAWSMRSPSISRNGSAMDATAYVELSDAVAAAATAEHIQVIEARLEVMDLHPLDRLALKRVAPGRRELIGWDTSP